LKGRLGSANQSTSRRFYCRNARFDWLSEAAGVERRLHRIVGSLSQSGLAVPDTPASVPDAPGTSLDSDWRRNGVALLDSVCSLSSHDVFETSSAKAGGPRCLALVHYSSLSLSSAVYLQPGAMQSLSVLPVKDDAKKQQIGRCKTHCKYVMQYAAEKVPIKGQAHCLEVAPFSFLGSNRSVLCLVYNNECGLNLHLTATRKTMTFSRFAELYNATSNNGHISLYCAISI
jgi:hypothetical protein